MGGRAGGLRSLSAPAGYMHHARFPAARGRPFSLGGMVGPWKSALPSNFGGSGDKYPPRRLGSQSAEKLPLVLSSLLSRGLSPAPTPLVAKREDPGWEEEVLASGLGSAC